MRESRGSATPREDAPAGHEAPVTADAGSVDVSLIDEMLRLTPAERLRQNDRTASLAARLRQAFAVGDVECPNPET
jgi:hypothetical protein